MSNQVILNTQIFFNEIFNAGMKFDENMPVQISENNKKLTVFNPEIARLPRLSDQESLISWLLRASGILEKDVIVDALKIASYSGVDPFDVLTTSGKLLNLDLKLARQASQLIAGNHIFRGFAAIAIAYASKNYTDLQTALNELDISPDQPFKRHPLVILLEKTKLVSPKALLNARQEALASGVTLGWVLLSRNIVGHNLLKILLESLIAIQNGRIEFEQVVSLIDRPEKSNSIDHIETVIGSHLELNTSERIFGNFILCSGNLNIDDWLFCAEVAVQEHMSLYQVCTELKVVRPDILVGVFQLANALVAKQIPARQCTILLEKYRRVAA